MAPASETAANGDDANIQEAAQTASLVPPVHPEITSESSGNDVGMEGVVVGLIRVHNQCLSAK